MNIWLRKLYFIRAAFSLIWVALAFTMPAIGGVLLVAYPAWDALMNAVDARRSGGFTANPPQAINAAVSAVTTVAMVFAVGRGMPAVFGVFGAWAVLAGLLQLGTAVRRWKHFGAQWAMALSGTQSALAGALFVHKASGPAPMLQELAGYAAVGAVYFLISASVLLYREVSSRGRTGER
jgi:uncharacterized membrane protein HdeD (DUF308 family)